MIRDGLSNEDREHRAQFAEYATRHASSEWHRQYLARLYEFWLSVNRDHFDGGCVEPHIVIAEPKTPRAIGDHSSVSGWGSTCQIRLRPSVLLGQHKMVKPGPEFAEGRYLVFQDILLHEAIHQYCEEVLGDPEDSYKRHGPTFARECNRVGRALGLPPVRPAKARGKNKDLPSCAQWPHNVRPRDYYLGALADDAQTFPCPRDPIEAAGVILDHFEGDARRLLFSSMELITTIMDRLSVGRDAKPDAVPDSGDPKPVPVSTNGDQVSANRDGKPVWKSREVLQRYQDAWYLRTVRDLKSKRTGVVQGVYGLGDGRVGASICVRLDTGRSKTYLVVDGEPAPIEIIPSR